LLKPLGFDPLVDTIHQQ